MGTLQNFIIILLFNFMQFETKAQELEGSGGDSDLIVVNDDFHLKFMSQLEKSVDSMVSKHMDSLEKRLQAYNEEYLERNLKTYIQNEISQANQISNNEISINEIKCSDNRLPESCYEVKECRKTIFPILIEKYSNKPILAACDFETLNSGWTIIQKRLDGSENFFRNWTDYVKGFGKMDGEFFLGLEKLHALTNFGPPQELYIIMEDFEGTRKFARYKKFQIEDESAEFRLNVGEYSGTAGDSLAEHNKCTFSTRDFGKRSDCAAGYKGAWWYYNCFKSNLNGMYLFGKYHKAKYGQGVVWSEFRGYEYSLKFVQMMIRPKQEE